MASGDPALRGRHLELRRLQEQLAARDAAIARLRARLAALEGHAAPSLVDALLEQVARAREQLRRREGGAEAGLRQEIERLPERLEGKERAMQPLPSQPRCEREEETLQPRRSLVEEERARAASRVLCRSLADETHQLRRALAATAHMCQHLAKRLDGQQHAQRGAGAQSADEAGHCQTGSDASDQAIIEKLQEENLLLKRKVTHVEDLNTKWQRYDASRDVYVRELHVQLRGLRALQESELMRKEIARLNRQLEEKTNECAEVKRELAAVRVARDAALERVQMLEQQILVYQHDFTSERADRERAQSRIQELEGKVTSLLFRVSQGQDSCEPGPRRMHTESNPIGRVETDASARRGAPGGRGLEPVAEDGGRGPARTGEGDLQCPHCLRCFSDELGDAFLRHVAKCCQ